MMKIISVEPAGYSNALALVCRRGGKSEIANTQHPYFKQIPEALKLKSERRRLGLSLGEVAVRCGLTKFKVSLLETSRAVFEDPNDYMRMMESMRKENSL